MLTVRAALAPKIAAAAEVKRKALYDELSHTSGGSGIKYAALPNRSSAPGQSPILQQGDLRDMVDAQEVRDLLWYVGMFPDDLAGRKKAHALEYGYSKGNLAARGYLERVKSDPVSTKAAKDAAQRG